MQEIHSFPSLLQDTLSSPISIQKDFPYLSDSSFNRGNKQNYSVTSLSPHTFDVVQQTDSQLLESFMNSSLSDSEMNNTQAKSKIAEKNDFSAELLTQALNSSTLEETVEVGVLAPTVKLLQASFIMTPRQTLPEGRLSSGELNESLDDSLHSAMSSPIPDESHGMEEETIEQNVSQSVDEVLRGETNETGQGETQASVTVDKLDALELPKLPFVELASADISFMLETEDIIRARAKLFSALHARQTAFQGALSALATFYKNRRAIKATAKLSQSIYTVGNTTFATPNATQDIDASCAKGLVNASNNSHTLLGQSDVHARMHAAALQASVTTFRLQLMELEKCTQLSLAAFNDFATVLVEKFKNYHDLTKTEGHIELSMQNQRVSWLESLLESLTSQNKRQLEEEARGNPPDNLLLGTKVVELENYKEILSENLYAAEREIERLSRLSLAESMEKKAAEEITKSTLKELVMIKSRNYELSQELESLARELEVMKTQHGLAAAESEILKHDLALAHDSETELRTRLESLQTALDIGAQTQLDLAMEKSVLVNKVEELKLKLQQYERHDQRSNVSDASASIALSEDTVFIEKYSSIVTEKDQLVLKNEQLSRENSNLKSQLDFVTKERDQLRESVESYRLESCSHSSAMESLRNEIRLLDQQVRDSKAELFTHFSSLEETQRELETNSKCLRDKQQELARLRPLLLRISTIVPELAASDAVLSTFSPTDVDRFEKSNLPESVLLEKSLMMLQRQIEELVDNFSVSYNRMNHETRVHKEENSSLSARLMQLQKQFETLKNSLYCSQELQKEKMLDWQSRVISSIAEISSKSFENEEGQEVQQVRKVFVNSLHSSQAKLEQEASGTEKVLLEASEKYSSLLQQFETYKEDKMKEILDLQCGNTLLREKVANLEQSLQTLTDEQELIVLNHNQLQENLSALEYEKATLEREVQQLKKELIQKHEATAEVSVSIPYGHCIAETVINACLTSFHSMYSQSAPYAEEPLDTTKTEFSLRVNALKNSLLLASEELTQLRKKNEELGTELARATIEQTLGQTQETIFVTPNRLNATTKSKKIEGEELTIDEARHDMNSSLAKELLSIPISTNNVNTTQGKSNETSESVNIFYMSSNSPFLAETTRGGLKMEGALGAVGESLENVPDKAVESAAAPTAKLETAFDKEGMEQLQNENNELKQKVQSMEKSIESMESEIQAQRMELFVMGQKLSNTKRELTTASESLRTAESRFFKERANFEQEIDRLNAMIASQFRQLKLFSKRQALVDGMRDEWKLKMEEMTATITELRQSVAYYKASWHRAANETHFSSIDVQEQEQESELLLLTPTKPIKSHGAITFADNVLSPGTIVKRLSLTLTESNDIFHKLTSSLDAHEHEQENQLLTDGHIEDGMEINSTEMSEATVPTESTAENVEVSNANAKQGVEETEEIEDKDAQVESTVDSTVDVVDQTSPIAEEKQPRSSEEAPSHIIYTASLQPSTTSSLSNYVQASPESRDAQFYASACAAFTKKTVTTSSPVTKFVSNFSGLTQKNVIVTGPDGPVQMTTHTLSAMPPVKYSTNTSPQVSDNTSAQAPSRHTIADIASVQKGVVPQRSECPEHSRFVQATATAAAISNLPPHLLQTPFPATACLETIHSVRPRPAGTEGATCTHKLVPVQDIPLSAQQNVLPKVMMDMHGQKVYFSTTGAVRYNTSPPNPFSPPPNKRADRLSLPFDPLSGRKELFGSPVNVFEGLSRVPMESIAIPCNCNHRTSSPHIMTGSVLEHRRQSIDSVSRPSRSRTQPPQKVVDAPATRSKSTGSVESSVYRKADLGNEVLTVGQETESNVETVESLRTQLFVIQEKLDRKIQSSIPVHPVSVEGDVGKDHVKPLDVDVSKNGSGLSHKDITENTTLQEILFPSEVIFNLKLLAAIEAEIVVDKKKKATVDTGLLEHASKLRKALGKEGIRVRKYEAAAVYNTIVKLTKQQNKVNSTSNTVSADINGSQYSLASKASKQSQSRVGMLSIADANESKLSKKVSEEELAATSVSSSSDPKLSRSTANTSSLKMKESKEHSRLSTSSTTSQTVERSMMKTPSANQSKIQDKPIVQANVSKPVQSRLTTHLNNTTLQNSKLSDIHHIPMRRASIFDNSGAQSRGVSVHNTFSYGAESVVDSTISMHVSTRTKGTTSTSSSMVASTASPKPQVPATVALRTSNSKETSTSVVPIPQSITSGVNTNERYGALTSPPDLAFAVESTAKIVRKDRVPLEHNAMHHSVQHQLVNEASQSETRSATRFDVMSPSDLSSSSRSRALIQPRRAATETAHLTPSSSTGSHSVASREILFHSPMPSPDSVPVNTPSVGAASPFPAYRKDIDLATTASSDASSNRRSSRFERRNSLVEEKNLQSLERVSRATESSRYPLATSPHALSIHSEPAEAPCPPVASQKDLPKKLRVSSASPSFEARDAMSSPPVLHNAHKENVPSYVKLSSSEKENFPQERKFGSTEPRLLGKRVLQVNNTAQNVPKNGNTFSVHTSSQKGFNTPTRNRVEMEETMSPISNVLSPNHLLEEWMVIDSSHL